MNKATVTKTELQGLYVDEKLTIKECSEVLGMSVGKIFNLLKKYEIPTRDRMTERTRMRISKSTEGKTHPRRPANEETKRRISESHRGVYLKPSAFAGHRKRRADGYIAVYCPDNPSANKSGYMMEHVLLMEKFIGRPLRADEVVHHKNHIRSDNRISNLQLMTFREHARLHMNERWEVRKESV